MPNGKEGEEETTTKKTDEVSNSSSTASPGMWIITILNHSTVNWDLIPHGAHVLLNHLVKREEKEKELHTV